MERRRRDVYRSLSGLSRFTRTPANFKHPYPYVTDFEICVCLPEEEQLVRSHPQMIRRLTTDFPKAELKSLRCSSGNFYQHLVSGKATMGHVAAEIWIICFDRFSSAIGLDHIFFHERVKARYPGDNPDGIEYRIRIFIAPRREENRDALDSLVRTGLLNDRVAGLEYLVVRGYLNACMRGFPFDIKKRLAQFIEHRQLWRLARDEPHRDRGR